MGNREKAGDRRFDRRLVAQGERRLIESTCRRCGAVIVGSVSESLADDEQEHVQQCRGQQAGSSEPVAGDR